MTVEWTDKADQRVVEIFEYHKSVDRARAGHKILKSIHARVRILIHNPRAGQREWSLEDEPQEFRRLVEGNYKIIYCVEGETVKIVDIWDCRRDPDALQESVAQLATTNN